MAFVRESGSGRDQPRSPVSTIVLAAFGVVSIVGILAVFVMAIAAMLRWSGMEPSKAPRQTFPIERLSQLARLP